MEAMRVRVRGGQRERVGRGRGRGLVRRRVSDDIRATLVDHVINHGLSMREAGQRVHPNLSRYTVASIIRTFRLENSIFYRMVGRPPQGGRERLFSQQQELAIIEMTFLDFDPGELPHEFIYVDEAGFNLAKTRRRAVT